MLLLPIKVTLKLSLAGRRTAKFFQLNPKMEKYFLNKAPPAKSPTDLLKVEMKIKIKTTMQHPEESDKKMIDFYSKSRTELTKLLNA
jgi:hypothetical protein